MYLEIQGAPLSQYVLDQQFKLARTYVGEIERTQTGVIRQFGESFVTLGTDLVFMAPRAIIDDIQQLLLSDDVVEIKTDYNATRIKGKFSCTQNACEEVRDKGTSLLRLTVSLVSDGSNIGDSNGAPFSMKLNGSEVDTAYFGKIFKFSTACRLPMSDGNYPSLPGNKILVLGPVNAITTP
jgi:hypothetical protein